MSKPRTAEPDALALLYQLQQEIANTYGACCICGRALVGRGDSRLLCARCQNADEESVEHRMIAVLVKED